jgi:hypothetical protein
MMKIVIMIIIINNYNNNKPKAVYEEGGVTKLSFSIKQYTQTQKLQQISQI